MTIFSLSYKFHKAEDNAVLSDLLETWQGWQVQESTWILKRNDGCTCQTIMDDLLEHIDAGDEVSVVEIDQKSHRAKTIPTH